MTVTSRLQHAWNAFLNKDPTVQHHVHSSGHRPDRTKLHSSHERSIIASLYNMISVDVASIDIKHAKVDENGKYLESIKSSLNEIFSIQANIDQTSRAFI